MPQTAARAAAFEKFQAAKKEFNYSLAYIPPELRTTLPGLKRNPTVLLRRMAELVPEDEVHDAMVTALADLADQSHHTLKFIVEMWWAPAGERLYQILGTVDTPWKQHMLDIWMNPDYDTSEPTIPDDRVDNINEFLDLVRMMTANRRSAM